MAISISESLEGQKRPRESESEPETSDIDHILSLDSKKGESTSDFQIKYRVERVMERIEGKKEGGSVEVFMWFKTHVIDYKLEPSIDHDELSRQVIDPNIYWFAIPNIGSILKGLSQGRKEVLSLINCRRYKEMMLAPLEKKRLRFSSLDMRFHLRDLIGSGHLRTVQTPTGLVQKIEESEIH